MKNIYLIGFMGSGKSTLGHELARHIRCRFIDMDIELEKEHALSIPEIFKKYNETQFRTWESDLLQKIASKQNLVVATGGGLPCFYNNIDILNNSGLTIYLKVAPEIIFERLVRRTMGRPLIQDYSQTDLKEYIQSTLKIREIFYLKAQKVINANTISVLDLLDIVGYK